MASQRSSRSASRRTIWKFFTSEGGAALPNTVWVTVGALECGARAPSTSAATTRKTTAWPSSASIVARSVALASTSTSGLPLMEA
ncbi:hypothetical protein D9M69_506220 [compost metagenome]